jgi:hypothetical protein
MSQSEPTQAEARALVEEVKRKHEQAGNVCLGHWLSTAHPCDASRLADALSASLAEVERLQEVYAFSSASRRPGWIAAGCGMAIPKSPGGA